MRGLGSSKALERRRYQAVMLHHQGLPFSAVARKLHVDRRSVVRWNSAYKHHGEEGIAAHPAPGAIPKLSEDQRRQLVEALLLGGRAAGFETDLWTCPRVVQFVRETFGVSYHVDHMGRLLHSLGFSPQKPQRKARERDEERVRTWVKRDWEAIKKKRPA